MKEWIKKHRGITVAGTILGVSGLTVLAWLVGRKYGANQLINTIINLYENGDDNMVVTSTDKTLGNRMYEISVECIGD